MAALRDRQLELFAYRYSRCLDATKAAREAGVPPRRAAQQAEIWLDDPLVKRRLAEILTPFIREDDIDRKQLLETWAKLAFFDPRRCFDERGQILPVSMMDDAAAVGIQSINMKKGTIAFRDRTPALSKLSEVLKLIQPENHGTGLVEVIINRFGEPVDDGNLD